LKSRASRPQSYGTYHLAADRKAHFESRTHIGRIQCASPQNRIGYRRMLLDDQSISGANHRREGSFLCLFD
jgi:hypothetical protein